MQSTELFSLYLHARHLHDEAVGDTLAGAESSFMRRVGGCMRGLYLALLARTRPQGAGCKP